MYFKHKARICIVFIMVCLLMNPTGIFAQNKKIDSLSQALNMHPKKDDQRARILFDLAAQNLQYDATSALKYVDEIISFDDKITNKNIVSAAYRVKGIVFYHLSKYNEALLLLNKALVIDNRLGSNDGAGGDLGTIGLIYMTQSKFPEALKYYLESLSRFEKTKKNQVDEALTLVNIGTVYNEMGNLEQAMSNYQKSYQLFQKIGHFPGQANTLTNIGIIHYKNKNIAEAIRYSERSLSIVDSLKDLRGIARENGNLSAYYNVLEYYDVALAFGLKAVELNNTTGNKKSQGMNMQNVSAAYLGKGMLQEAKSYGLKALQTGTELNVTELERDASKGLSEVYEALNMPDSALIYYKQYTKLADTISNDKKKNEITRMGIQYDFDKKELSYKQKELLTAAQLKQQQLQLALNQADLQKGIQLRNLQTIQLQNEKLLSEEKEKQLIISRGNEKLQASKVNALSQQQKLNQLELKQLWLYGLLALVILMSVLVYLLNLYRIRKLKYKNELQHQQAAQNELKLKHQYQLSESELKAIRAQMNPHFIFNVLNSIESYVMDSEKRKASRLIQKFASLSRLILENSTKSLVKGDKEWKALMLYTELEAMRYDDAFTYTFTVDEDVQLQTLYLPPMLIQPLIENAILHGLIVNPKAGAHLSVSLQKNGTGICVTVADNGIGIENSINNTTPGSVKEISMGLASIKERINMINQQQPGNKASFNIRNNTDGPGTVATLCLPFFEREGAINSPGIISSL